MLCKAEFTDWPNPVDSVGSLQNEVHNTLSLGKSFTEYLFDFFFFLPYSSSVFITTVLTEVVIFTRLLLKQIS